MPVEVQGTLDLSGILADGRVKEDGDLTISVNPFYYDISGTKGYYIGTVGRAVTNNQINYVYLDDTGTLNVSTVGYSSGLHIRLARVVASGGFITRVISERALFSTAVNNSFSNPMTTQGDIVVGGVSGIATRLGAQDGYYLKSNGTSASPTWVRTLSAESLVISNVINDTLSDPTAVLQVKATDKGVLLPALTKIQINNIVSPATGLILYNTDSKRFNWYDGLTWRPLITNAQNVITVSTDGSADFLTIQGAIDSISGQADNNRYIIQVSPAIYSENITPKGYVTITGTGWDTVIDGYITFNHALGDANVKDFRITTLNHPSIIINTDDEADLIGCYIFTTYNNSATWVGTRSSIEILKGTMYAYKESEITLTNLATLNTDPSLVYTCYNIYGPDFSWNESYGTFHYIDVYNSVNEINIMTNTGSNPDVYGWLKNTYTTINFFDTVHTNIVKLNNSSGAAGYIISDAGRVDLESDNPINPTIYLAVCENSLSGIGHSRWNRQLIRKTNISDANISLGYSTTIYDEVFVVEDVFLFSIDILPTRYLGFGSLGTFNYSISNNFGSRSFTGKLNGTRYYTPSATDPVLPTPSDSDKYYNTVLEENMYYDSSRSKWLSYSSQAYMGGRLNNTAPGSFYRGIDGLTFGPDIGYSVSKGTLVSLSLSKTDSGNSTLEVVIDNTQIATLVTNGAGRFIDTSINADFNPGLLKFRNLSSGTATSNVQITAVIKRRV